MRSTRLLCLASFLAVVGLVAALPLPPEAVLEAGPGVEKLWQTAQTGTFMNVLPEDLRYLQPEWTAFLKTKGQNLVEAYYA